VVVGVVMRPVMLPAVRRAVPPGLKWLLHVMALLDKSIRENDKIRRAAYAHVATTFLFWVSSLVSAIPNINVRFMHLRAHVSEFAAQGTKLEAVRIYKAHPSGVRWIVTSPSGSP
jgi:hypothetical protein